MALLDLPKSRRARSAPALPPVVRRSAQHGLVLTAVALTVLLAGTVLAALATLAGSTVNAGVVQELSTDPSASVQVSAAYSAGGLAVGDRDVRAALGRTFGAVQARTYLSLLGGITLSLGPGGAGGPAASGTPVAMHVSAAEGAAAHARLVGGSWPAGAADAGAGDFAALPGPGRGRGGAVAAAVPEGLAQQLHLGVGATLPLVDVAGRQVVVRVTGIYQATDTSADPGFWPALSGDPTDADGFAAGMLIVAPSSLVGSAALDQQVTVHWDAVPEFTQRDVGRLPLLAQNISTLDTSVTGLSVFQGQGQPLDSLSISSQLPQIISGLAAPTVVARSALYLPTALLAVLALLSLVLTARQLAEHRRSELVLQQTRGAGAGRLLGSAAAEWALLVLPAGLLAPFLAGPLLSGLHDAGLLGALLPSGTLGAAAWAAVGLTLVVHGVAALAPVVRTVSGGDAVARLRLRGPRSALAQRVGGDLALLLVAGVGYLQLRHYHSVVVGMSVDPVLVLVPMVSALAAAVLLLRAMPLAARALDVLGRSRRGLVVPLAGWHLSRRSARSAGPVVLMCLAVAVGSLATTAVAALDSLALDQARFTVGADVAVQTGAGSGQAGTAEAALHSALLALPGVTAVTPLTITPGTVDSRNEAEIVGIDTTRVDATAPAPPVPTLPGDLAGKDFPGRLASLDTEVPAYGLPLPTPGPSSAAARLTVTESLTSSDADVPTPTLTLTVEDAEGLTQTLAAVLPRPDGRLHAIDLPLAGAGTRLVEPLRITRVSVIAPGTLPPTPPLPSVLDVLTIGRITFDGLPVTALPSGLSWTDRTLLARIASIGACKDPRVTNYANQAGNCSISGGTASGPLLREVVSTGAPHGFSNGGSVDLAVEHGTTPVPVPALADERFLQSGNYRVGDSLSVDLGDGHGLTMRIVGTVAAVPGVDQVQGHLLVDQRVLAASAAQTGEELQPAATWLLSSSDSAATAAAVAANPALGTAQTTRQVLAQLRADPFRSGMRTVLALCRVLAPAFAVIGFTVFAVISTRERRREFALLRAMGARRGRLAALLWTEQLGVALFAVVPGALIGVALAVAILPKVVVDDGGGAPFPPLRLEVPWGPVALTALATAGVIWLVVALLARLLARVDLVRALRAGEDA